MICLAITFANKDGMQDVAYTCGFTLVKYATTLRNYRMHSASIAVTTCTKLELKAQHGNPHLLMRSKVYLCIF